VAGAGVGSRGAWGARTASRLSPDSSSRGTRWCRRRGRATAWAATGPPARTLGPRRRTSRSHPTSWIRPDLRSPASGKGRRRCAAGAEAEARVSDCESCPDFVVCLTFYLDFLVLVADSDPVSGPNWLNLDFFIIATEKTQLCKWEPLYLYFSSLIRN
jgi:hypothetical protein